MEMEEEELVAVVVRWWRRESTKWCWMNSEGCRLNILPSSNVGHRDDDVVDVGGDGDDFIGGI